MINLTWILHLVVPIVYSSPITWPCWTCRCSKSWHVPLTLFFFFSKLVDLKCVHSTRSYSTAANLFLAFCSEVHSNPCYFCHQLHVFWLPPNTNVFLRQFSPTTITTFTCLSSAVFPAIEAFSFAWREPRDFPRFSLTACHFNSRVSGTGSFDAGI